MVLLHRRRDSHAFFNAESNIRVLLLQKPAAGIPNKNWWFRFYLQSEPVLLIDTPVKHKLRFKFPFTCLKSGAIKQNSRWLVGTSRQNRIFRLLGNSDSIKIPMISKYGMHVASHTRV